MGTEDKRLQSRKRVIRNAALVFLGIVLFLTFFSKTINNMLLPEVECTVPWSGNLSYEVKASGEFKAQNTHKIFAQSDWHMVDVLVEEGDKVAKGDVLAMIDTDDVSLELKRKEFEIQKLRDELEQYQATFRGVDLEDYENQVEKASAEAEDAKTSLDIILALFDQDVQETIRTAQERRDKAIRNCEAAYEELEKKRTEADKLEAQYNRTVEEKKMAITVKKREMRYFRDNSESEMDDDEYSLQMDQYWLEIQRLENDLQDYIDGYEPLDLKSYEDAFNQSLQAVFDAEENLKKVSDTYANESEFRLRLNEAQKTYDDALKQVEESIRTLEKKQEEAKSEQLVYTQTIYEKKTEIQLAMLELEHMKEYLPQDGKLVAPMDATIKSVNIEKGQSCSPQQTLFELIADDSKLSVQWMLNPEKAELMSVGDDVTFSIKGEKTESFKGTVESKEFSSENGMYLYMTDIPAGSGKIKEGMAVEISASRASSQYQMIVPNSSISDQGGKKYVFVLKERNGALGQEYYVEAVQVSVIEEDDFNSAVSGGLSAQDKVVSTSTKALEDGAQVKLR